jgi:hypothetical protein
VRTHQHRSRRERVEDTRLRGAESPTAAVAALQRTAGNAAVAGLLGSQRVVQRNEESAKLLKQLAVPKIGEGPAIGVQKQLVDDLEKVLASEDTPEINLGGILLERVPDCYETNEDLFAKAVRGAKLVPLPSDIPKERFRSAGADRAADVIKAGHGPAVVENTLKTMIDAEQLEYLRLAGLPNDQWKILVEVHYIRSRPKDMTGFHKDTKGETLFVNLNYHVGDNKLMGPEYVVNPAPSEAHDKQIGGTLPKAFLDDLDVTRRTLGAPTEMRTGVVNPYGYVAFVDEAIHHATPYYGHRFVTGREFSEYLALTYPKEHAEIVRAYKKHKGSLVGGWYTLSDYVDKKIIGEGELAKWQTWVAMIADDKQTEKYTREHLAATMKPREIDLMIQTVGSFKGAERKGAGGFYAANIFDAGYTPVNESGRPPLERQASTADFKKIRPEPLPEKVPRRFLRTWVRVIPETKAAKLRTWAKEKKWTD